MAVKMKIGAAQLAQVARGGLCGFYSLLVITATYITIMD